MKKENLRAMKFNCLINLTLSWRKLEEEGKCDGLSKFQFFLGSSSVELERIKGLYPLQTSNNTEIYTLLSQIQGNLTETPTYAEHPA
ncbi:hypothetical protein OIU77_003759 [Salix suchowensis]|uniref:Uncharacterized protein n=1 Tax=Salix suchowensis TaxID=1278906 RepID=A0ABQ9AS57_9ROSI|nr:hypothetical protein OIU77_003759 [Salix suchowensis]